MHFRFSCMSRPATIRRVARLFTGQSFENVGSSILVVFELVTGMQDGASASLGGPAVPLLNRALSVNIRRKLARHYDKYVPSGEPSLCVCKIVRIYRFSQPLWMAIVAPAITSGMSSLIRTLLRPSSLYFLR